jgi:NADPH:quinone reductase-like Zn-dependent oxidoreductase
MKRIEYVKFGGPDVLQVRDFNLNDPLDDEVQIQTHFAGINFAEIMTRMGLYPGAPKPPSSIGGEASGIITKIGKNIQNYAVGDKVMVFAPFRSYSSHININEQMLMKLPESFSLDQGAAFPVIYMTAYMMMFDLGNLKKDEIFFIQGAGGGVGTAAIQLAKSVGAKIIGTSSGWKHERLKNMGVDLCIDYNTENVKEKIMDYTNGYGVDLIIDPVGGKQWSESYSMLAPMGKLIVYGNQNLVQGKTRSTLALAKEFFSMPKIKPFEMIGQNKAIMGYHLGRLKGAEHKIKRAMLGIYKMIEQGDVNPVVGKVFPFDQASQAHEYIQKRKNFGKVLLDFTVS